jgi:hypothetical protein
MLKRITNIVPVRADSIDSFIKTSEEKGATQVIANAISVDERYPDKTDYAYSAKFESRGADGKRIVY